MGLYESNLYCLEQRHKYIFERLQEEQGKDSLLNKREFGVFVAENGETGIFIIKSGTICGWNSAYNPREEAKNWAKQYETKDINRIGFIYGLGNGMFAEELCEVLGKGAQVFIYEPDRSSFEFILRHFDLTTLFLF